MPDGGRVIVKVTNQELQTMPFGDALEYYAPDLVSALPDHIPLDRFKRVVLTAVNQNPDLARADRRSLFNSCSRCAHDGLYPDGREAALVVFRTKVKRKVPNDNGELVEREFYADLVQYMPMVAGLRKRMRNTGEVLSADAQVVCRNDTFHYEFGDDPKIIHEPPVLGTERGETIGAYAIIKLANGEILREVMGRPEIERVRQFSRAKDGPAWTKSWDEMARKTVLRRCAKAAPTGADVERMLAADDRLPQISDDTPVREIPPRPRAEDFRQIEHVDDPEPDTSVDQRQEETIFEIVDLDGERHERPSAQEASDTLIGLFAEAKARGMGALEGAWEGNAGTIKEIIETLGQSALESLRTAYSEASTFIETKQHPGNRQDRPAPGAQPLDPARDATDTAEVGRTEHPEEQSQSSTSTERRSSPPISQAETVDSALRDEPKSLAVPVRKPVGKAADWQGTAEDMVLVIKKLTDPEELTPTGAFVQANRSALNNMRDGEKSAWITVMYELGQRERALRTGEQ
jgi:recombination protein RecT